MKTKPMSLANIQGKLSRAEMKQIMAGSGGHGCSATCKLGDEICGDINVTNCNDSLTECRAKWSDADTAVCSCS